MTSNKIYQSDHIYQSGHNKTKPYSKIYQDALIKKYFEYQRLLKKIMDSEKEQFEEWNVEELKKECTAIRNKLVEHNLRLVYKYYKANLKYLITNNRKDILSTAYMLVIDGINSYLSDEKNMQWKISSFIYKYLGVYGNRIREKYNSHYTMRLPYDVLDQLRKYRATRRQLEQEYTTVTKEEYEAGEHPTGKVTAKEIGTKLGWTEEKVRKLDILDRQISSPESLDELQESFLEEAFINGLYDDGIIADNEEPENIGLCFFMEHIAEEDPFTYIESKLLKKMIHTLLDQLEQTEHDTIIWFFGLDDGHPKSTKEIAEKLQLPRNKIRGILNKGVHKLKIKYEVYKEMEEHYKEDDGINLKSPQKPFPSQQLTNENSNSQEPQIDLDEVLKRERIVAKKEQLKQLIDEMPDEGEIDNLIEFLTKPNMK